MSSAETSPRLHSLDRSKADRLREVAKNPRSVEALCQLAQVCQERDERHAAESLYRRAFDIDPHSLQVRYGLASTCSANGRVDEAEEHIQACIAGRPEVPAFWGLLASLKREEGLFVEAEQHLRKALSLAPQNYRTAQRLLFQTILHPELSPETVRQEHERWAATYAALHYPATPPRLHLQPGKGRLRVGYLSPDWSRHSVGQFSECFLRHHDRTQIEVFCYYCSRRRDSRTAVLAALPEHWVEVGDLDDAQLCERIRKDDIHVLVDLAGHTPEGRPLALARQPAPVQMTALGYLTTTGIATIGYRLTDAFTDPPGMTESHATERLIRLPETVWCFAPLENTPAVAGLPCLTTGRITFGSFNRFFKVSSSTVELWAQIVRAVPGSRLLLKSACFRSPGLCARTMCRFAAAGIPPDQIELRGWDEDQADHLSGYSDIDIALDTFPYQGSTTICEALYMGVPVLSQVGTTHASRTGFSLLSNLGLAEACSAPTIEGLAAKALRLASDRRALATLRAELRPRMETSPLMDAPRYTRHLEAALQQLARDHST